MKRFLCLALCLTLSCAFSGCSDSNKETVKMDKLVTNFWTSETMYDESCMLVAKTDSNGNITESPKAKLLYNPTKVIEVKQYFHAENTGIVTFTEGTDFTIENGYIVAKGAISEDLNGKKTEVDTKMPFILDTAMTGATKFPSLNPSTDIPSVTDGLYLPFTESYQIVQMQISVTYMHDVSYSGTVPSYFGDTALTKSLNKLNAKEDVELLFFGDSISTGANSSSVLKITPNLPNFPELIATNLQKYFGGNVKLTNKSVGGWTSANGISSAPTTGWVGGVQISQAGIETLLDGELKGYAPDIAVIGFGMNDATAGLPLNSYYGNIKKMIDAIRAKSPDCDIILLGTILANPLAKNQSKNQMEYFSTLTKLTNDYTGICAINVGVMHEELLKVKNYIDMTSNNVNHPNDFLARVYAMNILSAFIK